MRCWHPWRGANHALPPPRLQRLLGCSLAARPPPCISAVKQRPAAAMGGRACAPRPARLSQIGVTSRRGEAVQRATAHSAGRRRGQGCAGAVQGRVRPGCALAELTPPRSAWPRSAATAGAARRRRLWPHTRPASPSTAVSGTKGVGWGLVGWLVGWEARGLALWALQQAWRAQHSDSIPGAAAAPPPLTSAG